MKHIKVRYIIGTFAIIAVVVINFTYAHNNYGIHNIIALQMLVLLNPYRAIVRN